MWPAGENQTSTLTFPNGTSATLQGVRTVSRVSPTRFYYTFSSVGVAGQGFSVFGSHPLDVNVLTGQNATDAVDDAATGAGGASTSSMFKSPGL